MTAVLVPRRPAHPSLTHPARPPHPVRLTSPSRSGADDAALIPPVRGLTPGRAGSLQTNLCALFVRSLTPPQ